jgi:hypothetical protein
MRTTFSTSAGTAKALGISNSSGFDFTNMN